jgi:hypothetical protein
VPGEQADGAVLEVGQDRLDLPTGQPTVPIGGGGHRQFPEPPGGLGTAGRVAAGTLGVVAEPGGHGGGPVVAPQLGGVVRTDGSQQLGIESICQRECLDQHGPGAGRVEAVDRPSEGFEGAADLP